MLNKWVGFTVVWFVPVVHAAEQSCRFVVGVRRGEPYFVDIPKLWKKHYGPERTLVEAPIEAPWPYQLAGRRAGARVAYR